MAKGIKTGGRQKGTPNKTTALLKDAILKAAEQSGNHIGADDHVLVYYGAADSVMGVARASVRDLVPVWDTL